MITQKQILETYKEDFKHYLEKLESSYDFSDIKKRDWQELIYAMAKLVEELLKQDCPNSSKW